MKCKQLLSVVLMLCMIASSCAVFAAPDYDTKYECSPISFGYEDGNVWTDAIALEKGKTVTAKVTAKTAGEAENMVFSVFLYDDGKMYDGEILTQEVTSEGVEFKASAEVPEDIEGCQVVAVLWNNLYDMEMICDSALFPGGSTKLRALYIDGVPVTGFDPDVTEYTYAIEPDAEKYPDITWETTDSSVKATLIKPKSFPGRSIVSVEAANGQKTEYCISYESTLGDIVSNVGGAAGDAVYVKGGIKVSAAAYSDRANYLITDISDPEYDGADMIMACIGWQSNSVYSSKTTYVNDWITFDINRGVTVKVLKSDTGATQHFIDEGFTLETSDAETGFVKTYTNADKNHKVAMSKHFDAGETVKIPSGMSGITYLVAIIHDPIGGIEEEPTEPVDESLLLSSLSIDGAAVAGFNADTTEYNHVLTADQLAAVNAPEVTYTLADEASTAVVTNPSSFPGSAAVTVTNAQNETKTYTINYDAGNIVANITPDAETTKQALYVAGGLRVGGHVASDRVAETSWAISEYTSELEGSDTILTPVDGWVGVVNNFTFTLGRKATVRVVQNQTNLLSAYTAIGFTADSDTTSRKLLINNPANSDTRIYTFMASKEYEPGEVTLPYTKPNMPTLTALEFIPWGNASAPDVSLDLTSVSIGGNELADFDADTLTYEYTLTDAQLAAVDAPEVTYTLADEASTAVVTNPSSFPGSVTITVTNAENQTRTYTINYKAETVKNLALNPQVPADAPQPKYVQNFRVGDVTFADRLSNFFIEAINDTSLIGKDRILFCLGWQNDSDTEYGQLYKSGYIEDWVTFTVARNAVVAVFEDAEADDYYQGFTKETSTNPPYAVSAASSPLNHTVKYYKTYAAGETVKLPNSKNGSRNGMCVITYAGWGEELGGSGTPDVPDVPEVDSLALTEIKIDGTALTGFDADTTEYEHTLTAAQLAAVNAPEVTYTLADEASTAVVTNPVSFPGFAEIKVTNGTEEKTYKITYEVPAIELKLADEAPANTPKPVIAESMQTGEPTFADRTTFPIEAINDTDIEGALWLKSCIGWQNDTNAYKDVYRGDAIADWVNFEVKRGMVVTVYEDTTTNGARFNYWTTEASSDTPYIVSTASSPLKYIVRHRRYFAPGETAEIPNITGSRTYTAAIRYLGWGEEAPELDVAIPEVRQISYSDLVAKVPSGENANVTEGQWSGVSSTTTTKYQLSKEFADITEPTEISFTTDKINKGYGIIVVAPLDSAAEDKNVIVNSDGSALEWTEDTNVIADYSYVNSGDEDFDAANATYGRYNAEAVTFSGGAARVYEKMHNSDDMYITGSLLGINRLPYSGELHWTNLPEEYLGCNYIAVNFDTGYNGGERTFTFTVNQPVKIWVHSSSSDMTVTDTVNGTEWTASQYAVTRRYQNVLDHLSCAYMIKKGYINESNIVYDGRVGITNGVRFNRYDVLGKLEEDCGGKYGWAIDPEKLEATGFTDSINSYRYEEYLEAWVD